MSRFNAPHPPATPVAFQARIPKALGCSTAKYHGKCGGIPIWTGINLDEYSYVSTDTPQLRLDELRPSKPRASLKDILLAVLPVALIMSGFFWLGYWTAASDDYPHDPVVLSEHHEERAASPSSEKSSAETSLEEQAADQEVHHWIGL